MPPKEQHIVLRTFTTYSLLPCFPVLTKDGSVWIDDHCSFVATRCTPESEYYELAWCSAEEVALLSSVIIGAHPEWGKALFYPVRWPYKIEDVGQDLADPKVLAAISDDLRQRLVADYANGRGDNSWDELPPLLKKRPYRFNESLRLESSYQGLVHDRIRPSDDLLIRGLSHLLKSAMLRCLGRSFIDTACLEIFVSLEATLHIILSRLREAGNPDPSNRDASDYLMEAFGEDHRPQRYYSDYYDDRIKALHPASRFGIAKFVPLYVDDLFMLYNDLLRNFEYLITDVPNCYLGYYPVDIS